MADNNKVDVIGRNGPRPTKKRGRNRNTVKNKASKKDDFFRKFERLMGDEVKAVNLEVGGSEWKLERANLKSGGNQEGVQESASKTQREKSTPQKPSPQTTSAPMPNLIGSPPVAPPTRMAELAQLAIDKNPKTANRAAARGEMPPALSEVPGQYQDDVMRASRATGVAPGLIAAVMKVESGYNPKAVSSAGAKGLMQSMPFWSDSKDDPMGRFDPTKRPRRAIMLGAKILDHYIEQQGSRRKGLQAYNAGPGNMPAGADYARLVLQTLRQLRGR